MSRCRNRGLPVTVDVAAQKDLSAMVGPNDPATFGKVTIFEVGADKFVEEQPNSVGGDLFQEAADAPPLDPPIENA